MTALGSDAHPSWLPDPDTARRSAIARFAEWCAAERGAPVGTDYHSLWTWSVEQLEDFWSAVWDWFDIRSDTAYSEVLSGAMPEARWFAGAQLNYADHALRGCAASARAIVDVAESTAVGLDPVVRELPGSEVQRQVAALAATLRGLGVVAGDRVIGYLPNIAEATIAFLAAASLGAVWSSCGQDYGAPAAATRFGQLEPVVLVAADGYRFAGQERDRRAEVAALRSSLPTLRATILVDRLGLGRTPRLADVLDWHAATAGEHDLAPHPVPFEHPLWVLFSSGTTGSPKGIVHSHGGVLLEHLKSLSLHLDLGRQDTFFWYTTPSWMVWNYLVSGLLTGATVLCYDGSPTYPGTDALWSLAARFGVTYFGASPGYLLGCAKAGVEPARDHDLSRLRAVGSSGSHLPAEANHWVADHVGPRIQVNSISGGTDVVSAFAGAAPTTPVWPGELSARCLGVAMESWDQHARPVHETVGELVITRPMPSMPLRFWGDADGRRYRDAYFDFHPGIWRHGDWITITGRGSVVVHGRSDSTLNRNGVRMGSAEIYQAVEALPEVSEALVIGAEQTDGSYWMPLFLRLADGHRLDEALRDRVREVIRREVSPRHLPDDLVEVPAVPHTRTGKKLEIPVKRILQGAATDTVADPGAVDNPDLLHHFASYRIARLNARHPGIPAGDA